MDFLLENWHWLVGGSGVAGVVFGGIKWVYPVARDYLAKRSDINNQIVRFGFFMQQWEKLIGIMSGEIEKGMEGATNKIMAGMPDKVAEVNKHALAVVEEKFKALKEESEKEDKRLYALITKESSVTTEIYTGVRKDMTRLRNAMTGLKEAVDNGFGDISKKTDDLASEVSDAKDRINVIEMDHRYEKRHG